MQKDGHNWDRGLDPDVFTPLPGCTDLIQHPVETRPGVAVYSSVTRTQEKGGSEGIGSHAGDGVIRRVQQCLMKPIVVVARKDGTIRFCGLSQGK